MPVITDQWRNMKQQPGSVMVLLEATVVTPHIRSGPGGGGGGGEYRLEIVYKYLGRTHSWPINTASYKSFITKKQNIP